MLDIDEDVRRTQIDRNITSQPVRQGQRMRQAGTGFFLSFLLRQY